MSVSRNLQRVCEPESGFRIPIFSTSRYLLVYIMMYMRSFSRSCAHGKFSHAAEHCGNNIVSQATMFSCRLALSWHLPGFWSLWRCTMQFQTYPQKIRGLTINYGARTCVGRKIGRTRCRPPTPKSRAAERKICLYDALISGRRMRRLGVGYLL